MTAHQIRLMGRIALFAIAAAGLISPGCIKDHPFNPAATQPVTVVDPQLADANYWRNQPASVEVSLNDLTTLWDTCEWVARDYFFKIDRRDHRSGLLTTLPLISKQWFEPLRKDGVTTYDVKEASMAAIRRTIYFQFTAKPEGGYSVAPKVVVERESRVDPKYRSQDAERDRDKSTDLPVTYWYAVRRDAGLEARLAQSIRERLKNELSAAH